MKKYLIFAIIVGLASCTTTKTIENLSPITQNTFLESPFGFDETIDNFSNQTNPKFYTQKLLRKNKHHPEITDTIYQFSYKKSEIFFYKTHNGKEFLLAGKVLNKQICLKNNIHVGIKKDEFISKFSNVNHFKTDSLEMIGEGTKYTFIFKDDKLYRINIDNYFD